MKKLIRAALATVGLFLLAALPAFCDRLWATIAVEYGTASSTFGLVAPSFTVPVQNNSSADILLSAAELSAALCAEGLLSLVSRQRVLSHYPLGISALPV